LIAANVKQLLGVLGAHELQAFIPALFDTQDSNVEVPRSVYNDQALHALIANILLFIGLKFEVPQLLSYITQVLDERRAAGEDALFFTTELEGAAWKASQPEFPRYF
jgi:hypothetical protein